jgi:hypothetical protein
MQNETDKTLLAISRSMKLGERRSKGPIMWPSRSRPLGTEWTMNTSTLSLNTSLYAQNLHRNWDSSRPNTYCEYTVRYFWKSWCITGLS